MNSAGSADERVSYPHQYHVNLGWSTNGDSDDGNGVSVHCTVVHSQKQSGIYIHTHTHMGMHRA